MSTLKVDTIQKADGSGSLSVPAESGTVVTTASPSLGRRNLVINGAMQVAQRGTSFTGITNGATYFVDRWVASFTGSNNGTWTFAQSTDAPDGFTHSMKMTCTSGYTSGVTNYLGINTRIENQDLQHLKFGTSNAKSLTVSFWVKASKTGNLLFEVYKDRHACQLAAINSADTWEYKTLTFSGDTVQDWLSSGANAGGYFNFFLLLGSKYKTGTLPTSFTNYAEANRGVGMTNFGDTNDYVAITGVQLEVGSVATPFEHRSYGEELALCKRYYQGLQGMHLIGNAGGSNVSGSMHFPEMRATPSFSQTGVLLITDPGVVDKAQSSTSVSIVAGRASVKAAQLGFGNFSGITQRYIYSDNISNATGQVVLDAEL